MKNDFINNMTHEFKTPIATVALACEALTDNDIVASAELSQNYIRIISEENHRLGSMAERILQTAVLEKGQVKLKSDRVNVHSIIDDVIKNIHLQVEARAGRLVTMLEAENAEIVADRIHLTNVIFNLTDNAMKYSPDKPLITIKTKNTTDGITISVSDNGIGISKANQKRIFEKLFRVSTGNIHDVKGFGLGLSYVRFIVERHGGTITVDSEIGQGSCFTVNLPFLMKQKFQDQSTQADSFIKKLFPWKS
jgi:two-component system phosphate regulon sensor histidine kinase PhoR